ncbi:MAG: potassium channel family protein [Candidatus Thorarchaeota archaeon]
MSPRKRLKPIKYEAVPVRNLLTRMKTLSELMLDLAYSAVLFSDKSLGEWVLELEELVDDLGYQLLMTLSIAVRDKNDAEASIGLFSVSSSADKISNAAADIATLATTGEHIHPLLTQVFQKTEEHLVQVNLIEGSDFVGRTLKDIWESKDLSVDVIAVRRNGLWTLNPPSDFVLQSGDVIFARGTGHETNLFTKMATGAIREHANSPVLLNESIDELLLKMKELSEFMVSLAYASVVHYDTKLAEEVGELEDRIDEMCEAFIRQVLVLDDDIDRRWGLVRVAVATEEIADAAWEIATIPYSGLETNPIIARIVNEAEEVVTRLEVHQGSFLDGHTLGELALDDNYGVYIQSVRRSGHWFHRPKDEFRLRAGDVLIVDGYKEGVEQLRRSLEQDSEKQ